MKISFIIPAYNAGKYIKRCLDSIKAQNLPDYEIITVNDGSNDDTLEILQHYAIYEPRLRIINKTNGGVSAARNDGLDTIKGDAVMFVDADDYLIDSALWPLGDLSADSLPDLTIYNMIRKAKSGQIDANHRKSEITYRGIELISMIAHEGTLLIGSPWAKLYKASILKKHNIKFTPGQILYEDACFNFDYIEYCKEVKISDKAIYYYDTSGSVSSGFHGEIYIRDHKTYISKQIRLISNLNNLWGGGRNDFICQAQAKIIQRSAYDHLWEIYRLYRSQQHHKIESLRMIVNYAEEWNPQWSRNIAFGGLPYILARISDYSITAMHLCLSAVFTAESIKHRISQICANNA